MGDDAECPRPVLVIGGTDPAHDELVARIGGLGFEPVCCPTPETALLALEEAEEPIHCVLVSSERADRNLKRALKPLRKLGAPAGLHLAAFGQEPDRAGRRRLRSAGVHYALWQPIEESTLRFQLNRLTRSDPGDEIRRARRVPTHLPARALAGGRSRDAIVYSLSEAGAFLETPRACMNGARVEIELVLPTGMLVLSSTVAFANVPGNLQRPNLPLGMGVHFDQPAAAGLSALADYVETRSSQLVV
jgi:hypothetical protein